MTGWDDPATASAYERFCRRHLRYRRANAVLVREAAILPGLRVLDLGAGSGRTASAALRYIGRDGAVVCVEPAGAMRAAGQRRVRDPRVSWRAGLPSPSGPPSAFDRVLAGAVIWQLGPPYEWIDRLASLLRPGGALAFNVPALYLGEADEAGGGLDPQLVDLVTRLASESPSRAVPSPASGPTWDCRREDIEAALRRARLRYRAWEFRHRLTQVAYAHWLSIPVVSEGFLAGVQAGERVRRIEQALAAVDRHSYKWERWRGWTAWKS
jgi:SAM-dependent methyltransferase